MTQIKHVSLDAWNTILVPSKKYAEVRTRILSRFFNCSEEFAKKVYSAVKKKFDTCAEEKGEAFSVQHVYDELMKAFPNIGNMRADELRTLYLEPTFLDHPPMVLTETVEAIASLKERGITVSISSNTNFISGDVLGPFLRKNAGDFDFMLFSDKMNGVNWESGVIKPAKPHTKFFEEVLRHAEVLHPNGLTDLRSVIHIGDSNECDFKGAAKFGFQARLLTSVDELPAFLSEI